MSKFFIRFLYPIRIVAGANVVVTDGGNIPIPPGTYYLRTDAGGLNDRYPSFLTAFSDAALAVIGDDFIPSWHAPTGYKYKESLQLQFSGLTIFQFDDPAFTLPKEILGFPPDINVAVPSVDEGWFSFIRGTRSALGSWIAGTVDGGDWRSINSHIEKEIYSSTEPIYERSKIIRMREDRVIRSFDFENVPGLRVQGGNVRGVDVGYRNTADLPLEITDGFASDGDALGLRSMYTRLNGGEEFLAIYEDEDEFGLVPGLFEGLRLALPSQHASFEEWYDMTRPGGEFYDVNFVGLRVAGGYDY